MMGRFCSFSRVWNFSKFDVSSNDHFGWMVSSTFPWPLG